MASKTEVTRATSRRAKREAAQKGNARTLQEQVLAEPELNKRNRENPAPKPETDPLETKTEKAVRKARAKKQRDEAVKAKVAEEGQMSANPELTGSDTDEIALAPGRQVDLHTANRLARRTNVAIRDEAVEHGQAVGRFAKEHIIGRADKGRHSRLAKVRRVQAQAEQKQRAAKAK